LIPSSTYFSKFEFSNSIIYEFKFEFSNSIIYEFKFDKNKLFRVQDRIQADEYPKSR